MYWRNIQNKKVRGQEWNQDNNRSVHHFIRRINFSNNNLEFPRMLHVTIKWNIQFLHKKRTLRLININVMWHIIVISFWENVFLPLSKYCKKIFNLIKKYKIVLKILFERTLTIKLHLQCHNSMSPK